MEELDGIGNEIVSRRSWVLIWVLVGASGRMRGLKVPQVPGLGSAEVGENSSAEESSDGDDEG